MDVEITYGGEAISISVPGQGFLGELRAPAAGKTGVGDNLLMATSEPLGMGPLHEFAREGEPVLVLVNDATRPTPTAGMLSRIWEQIGGWDLSFLVATGTHRDPSEAECRRIFGDLWQQVKAGVHIHDAQDADGLVPVGSTSAGTEVRFNRVVAEAEKILVISSVEAHYFAGYTGGRKIFLPGVAGRDTIAQNHRLAMKPEARALALKDNPVHRDMDEALDLLDGKSIFSVLAVLDREHNIHHAVAGDIREAFSSAARTVDQVVTVPFREKADIVVAVAAPPLDRDLYQAQKSVENGQLALKGGGILILVSACSDGVGSEAFMRVLSGKDSPAEVLARLDEDYCFGYHKAARLAGSCSRHEIWAVTGVDDSLVETAFMKPFTDIQGALDAALEAKEGGNVWILHDAGATVPRPV